MCVEGEAISIIILQNPLKSSKRTSYTGCKLRGWSSGNGAGYRNEGKLFLYLDHSKGILLCLSLQEASWCNYQNAFACSGAKADLNAFQLDSASLQTQPLEDTLLNGCYVTKYLNPKAEWV